MVSQPAKTLLVFAHPAPERGRVVPALAKAVMDLPGLTFRDLYELYPDFSVDIGLEQRLLCGHDLVVLQFPLLWWSTPALLKEWFDLVWRRGFAYGEGGVALSGKSLLCGVSAGGRARDYCKEGRFGHSVEEFLRPLERTAHLCGMRWETPFVVHGETAASDAALRKEALRWRERLETAGRHAGSRR